MKYIRFIWVLLIAGNVLAQEKSNYNWNSLSQINVPKEAVWAVDGLEQIYMADSKEVKKYASDGRLMFSQSIKALGKISQIEPINTMKLLLFSDQQQNLCYFDNTLSRMEKCVELSDRDVFNAHLVARSSQPDKFWVLDELNSSLRLLSIHKNGQEQEIKNLRGILNLDQITQMIERGNRLFLLVPEKGVYIFDLYGSLIDYFEIKDAQCIDADEEHLFVLSKDVIVIHPLNLDGNLEIELPVENISTFKIQNKKFFFRTESIVHKFALQIVK